MKMKPNHKTNARKIDRSIWIGHHLRTSSLARLHLLRAFFPARSLESDSPAAGSLRRFFCHAMTIIDHPGGRAASSIHRLPVAKRQLGRSTRILGRVDRIIDRSRRKGAARAAVHKSNDRCGPCGEKIAHAAFNRAARPPNFCQPTTGHFSSRAAAVNASINQSPLDPRHPPARRLRRG